MPVKGDDTCLIFDEDVFDDLDFKLDENTSHHVQKFCGVSTIVLWFFYVNLIFNITYSLIQLFFYIKKN